MSTAFGSSLVHIQVLADSLQVGSFTLSDGSAIAKVPGLFVLLTGDGVVVDSADAKLRNALTTSLVVTGGMYKDLEVQLTGQTAHQFKVKVAMRDGSFRDTAIKKKSLGFALANPRRNTRRSTRKDVTPVPTLPEHVSAEFTFAAATRAAEGNAAAVEAEPASVEEVEPVAEAPVDEVVDELQADEAAAAAEPVAEDSSVGGGDFDIDADDEEPENPEEVAEGHVAPVAEAALQPPPVVPQPEEAEVAVEEPVGGPEDVAEVLVAPVAEARDDGAVVPAVEEQSDDMPPADGNEDVLLDDLDGGAFELDVEVEDIPVPATEGGRGVKRDAPLYNGELYYPAGIGKRRRRGGPTVPPADPSAIVGGGDIAGEGAVEQNDAGSDSDSDSDPFDDIGNPEDDPEIVAFFEREEARRATRRAQRNDHASDQSAGPDADDGSPARKRVRLEDGDEEGPGAAAEAKPASTRTRNPKRKDRMRRNLCARPRDFVLECSLLNHSSLPRKSSYSSLPSSSLLNYISLLNRSLSSCAASC